MLTPQLLVLEVCKSTNFHFILLFYPIAIIQILWILRFFLTPLTFASRFRQPPPILCAKVISEILYNIAPSADLVGLPLLISLQTMFSVHQQTVVILPVASSLAILWSFHSACSNLTNNFPYCTTSNTLLHWYRWDLSVAKSCSLKKGKMPV